MFVIKIFLLTFLIQQGLCCKPTSCYICDSETDLGCDYRKPPEKYLKKCPLTSFHAYATQCMKKKVSSPKRGGGRETVVTRSCSYSPRPTNVDYCDGDNKCTQVGTCWTDGCNTSNTKYFYSRSNMIIALLFTSIITVMHLYHWTQQDAYSQSCVFLNCSERNIFLSKYIFNEWSGRYCMLFLLNEDEGRK